MFKKWWHATPSVSEKSLQIFVYSVDVLELSLTCPTASRKVTIESGVKDRIAIILFEYFFENTPDEYLLTSWHTHRQHDCIASHTIWHSTEACCATALLPDLCCLRLIIGCIWQSLILWVEYFYFLHCIKIASSMRRHRLLLFPCKVYQSIMSRTMTVVSMQPSSLVPRLFS